jgi:hypothetical protein
MYSALKNFGLIKICIAFLAIQSCDGGRDSSKTRTLLDNNVEDFEGVACDTFQNVLQPGHVLITGLKQIRLTPIFRATKNRRSDHIYFGTVSQHFYYDYDASLGDNFNNHLLPGFTTVFGYNMVNVSVFDYSNEKAVSLFKKPVLINNLYYPCDTKDTLRYKPISRNYIMVSVYDKDTNKDSFIDNKDLRHFYLFDHQGSLISSPIPENYNVQKSEYDAVNDVMYIFAQLDSKLLEIPQI